MNLTYYILKLLIIYINIKYQGIFYYNFIYLKNKIYNN